MDAADADEEWSDEEFARATRNAEAEKSTINNGYTSNTKRSTTSEQLSVSPDPISIVLDRIDAELEAMRRQDIKKTSNTHGRSSDETQRLPAVQHKMSLYEGSYLGHKRSEETSYRSSKRAIAESNDGAGLTGGASSEKVDKAGAVNSDIPESKQNTDDPRDLDPFTAQEIDAKFKEILMKKKGKHGMSLASRLSSLTTNRPSATMLSTGYGTDNDSVKTEDFESKFLGMMVPCSENETEFQETKSNNGERFERLKPVLESTSSEAHPTQKSIMTRPRSLSPNRMSLHGKNAGGNPQVGQNVPPLHKRSDQLFSWDDNFWKETSRKGPQSIASTTSTFEEVESLRSLDSMGSSLRQWDRNGHWNSSTTPTRKRVSRQSSTTSTSTSRSSGFQADASGTDSNSRRQSLTESLKGSMDFLGSHGNLDLAEKIYVERIFQRVLDWNNGIPLPTETSSTNINRLLKPHNFTEKHNINQSGTKSLVSDSAINEKIQTHTRSEKVKFPKNKNTNSPTLQTGHKNERRKQRYLILPEDEDAGNEIERSYIKPSVVEKYENKPRISVPSRDATISSNAHNSDLGNKLSTSFSRTEPGSFKESPNETSLDQQNYQLNLATFLPSNAFNLNGNTESAVQATDPYLFTQPYTASHAERVLMGLGFGAAEGFLPERFLKDWYDKISKAQIAALADMKERGSLDKIIRSNSNPLSRQTSLLRNSVELQQRQSQPSWYSSSGSSAFEDPAAILIPAHTSGHDFRFDNLRDYIELYNNMQAASETRELKMKQFAGSRQASLPVFLESTSLDTETRSRTSTLDPFDKEARLQMFISDVLSNSGKSSASENSHFSSNVSESDSLSSSSGRHTRSRPQNVTTKQTDENWDSPIQYTKHSVSKENSPKQSRLQKSPTVKHISENNRNKPDLSPKNGQNKTPELKKSPIRQPAIEMDMPISRKKYTSDNSTRQVKTANEEVGNNFKKSNIHEMYNRRPNKTDSLQSIDSAEVADIMQRETSKEQNRYEKENEDNKVSPGRVRNPPLKNIEPAMVSIVLEDVDEGTVDFQSISNEGVYLGSSSRRSSYSLSPIPQSPVTVIEVGLDNQQDSLDTEPTGSSKDSEDETTDTHQPTTSSSKNCSVKKQNRNNSFHSKTHKLKRVRSERSVPPFQDQLTQESVDSSDGSFKRRLSLEVPLTPEIRLMRDRQKMLKVRQSKDNSRDQLKEDEGKGWSLHTESAIGINSKEVEGISPSIDCNRRPQSLPDDSKKANDCIQSQNNSVEENIELKDKMLDTSFESNKIRLCCSKLERLSKHNKVDMESDLIVCPNCCHECDMKKSMRYKLVDCNCNFYEICDRKKDLNLGYTRICDSSPCFTRSAFTVASKQSQDKIQASPTSHWSKSDIEAFPSNVHVHGKSQPINNLSENLFVENSDTEYTHVSSPTLRKQSHKRHMENYESTNVGKRTNCTFHENNGNLCSHIPNKNANKENEDPSEYYYARDRAAQCDLPLWIHKPKLNLGVNCFNKYTQTGIPMNEISCQTSEHFFFLHNHQTINSVQSKAVNTVVCLIGQEHVGERNVRFQDERKLPQKNKTDFHVVDEILQFIESELYTISQKDLLRNTYSQFQQSHYEPMNSKHLYSNILEQGISADSLFKELMTSSDKIIIGSRNDLINEQTPTRFAPSTWHDATKLTDLPTILKQTKDNDKKVGTDFHIEETIFLQKGKTPLQNSTPFRDYHEKEDSFGNRYPRPLAQSNLIRKSLDSSTMIPSRSHSQAFTRVTTPFPEQRSISFSNDSFDNNSKDYFSQSRISRYDEGKEYGDRYNPLFIFPYHGLDLNKTNYDANKTVSFYKNTHVSQPLFIQTQSSVASGNGNQTKDKAETPKLALNEEVNESFFGKKRSANIDQKQHSAFQMSSENQIVSPQVSKNDQIMLPKASENDPLMSPQTSEKDMSPQKSKNSTISSPQTTRKDHCISPQISENDLILHPQTLITGQIMSPQTNNKDQTTFSQTLRKNHFDKDLVRLSRQRYQQSLHTSFSSLDIEKPFMKADETLGNHNIDKTVLYLTNGTADINMFLEIESSSFLEEKRNCDDDHLQHSFQVDQISDGPCYCAANKEDIVFDTQNNREDLLKVSDIGADTVKLNTEIIVETENIVKIENIVETEHIMKNENTEETEHKETEIKKEVSDILSSIKINCECQGNMNFTNTLNCRDAYHLNSLNQNNLEVENLSDSVTVKICDSADIGNIEIPEMIISPANLAHVDILYVPDSPSQSIQKAAVQVTTSVSLMCTPVLGLSPKLVPNLETKIEGIVENHYMSIRTCASNTDADSVCKVESKLAETAESRSQLGITVKDINAVGSSDSINFELLPSHELSSLTNDSSCPINFSLNTDHGFSKEPVEHFATNSILGNTYVIHTDTPSGFEHVCNRLQRNPSVDSNSTTFSVDYTSDRSVAGSCCCPDVADLEVLIEESRQMMTSSSSSYSDPVLEMVDSLSEGSSTDCTSNAGEASVSINLKKYQGLSHIPALTENNGAYNLPRQMRLQPEISSNVQEQVKMQQQLSNDLTYGSPERYKSRNYTAKKENMISSTLLNLRGLETQESSWQRQSRDWRVIRSVLLWQDKFSANFTFDTEEALLPEKHSIDMDELNTSGERVTENVDGTPSDNIDEKDTDKGFGINKENVHERIDNNIEIVITKNVNGIFNDDTDEINNDGMDGINNDNFDGIVHENVDVMNDNVEELSNDVVDGKGNDNVDGIINYIADGKVNDKARQNFNENLDEIINDKAYGKINDSFEGKVNADDPVEANIIPKTTDASPDLNYEHHNSENETSNEIPRIICDIVEDSLQYAFEIPRISIDRASTGSERSSKDVIITYDDEDIGNKNKNDKIRNDFDDEKLHSKETNELGILSYCRGISSDDRERVGSESSNIDLLIVAERLGNEYSNEISENDCVYENLQSEENNELGINSYKGGIASDINIIGTNSFVDNLSDEPSGEMPNVDEIGTCVDHSNTCCKRIIAHKQLWQNSQKCTTETLDQSLIQITTETLSQSAEQYTTETLDHSDDQFTTETLDQTPFQFTTESLNQTPFQFTDSSGDNQFTHDSFVFPLPDELPTRNDISSVFHEPLTRDISALNGMSEQIKITGERKISDSEFILLKKEIFDVSNHDPVYDNNLEQLLGVEFIDDTIENETLQSLSGKDIVLDPSDNLRKRFSNVAMYQNSDSFDISRSIDLYSSESSTDTFPLSGISEEEDTQGEDNASAESKEVTWNVRNRFIVAPDTVDFVTDSKDQKDNSNIDLFSDIKEIDGKSQSNNAGYQITVASLDILNSGIKNDPDNTNISNIDCINQDNKDNFFGIQKTSPADIAIIHNSEMSSYQKNKSSDSFSCDNDIERCSRNDTPIKDNTIDLKSGLQPFLYNHSDHENKKDIEEHEPIHKPTHKTQAHTDVYCIDKELDTNDKKNKTSDSLESSNMFDNLTLVSKDTFLEKSKLDFIDPLLLTPVHLTVNYMDKNNMDNFLDKNILNRNSESQMPSSTHDRPPYFSSSGKNSAHPFETRVIERKTDSFGNTTIKNTFSYTTQVTKYNSDNITEWKSLNEKGNMHDNENNTKHISTTTLSIGDYRNSSGALEQENNFSLEKTSEECQEISSFFGNIGDRLTKKREFPGNEIIKGTENEKKSPNETDKILDNRQRQEKTFRTKISTKITGYSNGEIVNQANKSKLDQLINENIEITDQTNIYISNTLSNEKNNETKDVNKTKTDREYVENEDNQIRNEQVGLYSLRNKEDTNTSNEKLDLLIKEEEESQESIRLIDFIHNNTNLRENKPDNSTQTNIFNDEILQKIKHNQVNMSKEKVECINTQQNNQGTKPFAAENLADKSADQRKRTLKTRDSLLLLHEQTKISSLPENDDDTGLLTALRSQGDYDIRMRDKALGRISSDDDEVDFNFLHEYFENASHYQENNGFSPVSLNLLTKQQTSVKALDMLGFQFSEKLDISNDSHNGSHSDEKETPRVLIQEPSNDYPNKDPFNHFSLTINTTSSYFPNQENRSSVLSQENSISSTGIEDGSAKASSDKDSLSTLWQRKKARSRFLSPNSAIRQKGLESFVQQPSSYTRAYDSSHPELSYLDIIPKLNHQQKNSALELSERHPEIAVVVSHSDSTSVE